ncbi:MAG: sensor histidine kinase [Flammeovirgaceae bacterium]
MVTNKHRWYWTMQVSGWSLYAGLQIAATILASGKAGVYTERIIFLSYESLFCLLVSHLFRNAIIQWKWLNLDFSKLIPRVLLAVFTMGAVVYLLRIPVSLPLGLFKYQVAFNPFTFLGQSFFYAIIFFLWAALYFAYTYVERYNMALRYEASVKEIELNNLKSQLNPHFIFNALNSIRALVDENPEKSKLAINQLSNILRNSLVRESKGLINFQDEIRMVKDYLGLESIRFEERLRTEFDIASGSDEFLVPPLMIQTLVENGVKHGISKLKEGGLLQVSTRVIEDELKIRIRNSGYYTNDKERPSGLGLANTIQRLKLLYGNSAYFKITNEKDNFVLTEISIPHLHLS